jgi:asparagine synthase (glutamine-hydrolysing)
MCGIVGMLGRDGRPVDAERVRRMRESLTHRGPDGAGLEQPDSSVVLGHRRLSIIDVDGGHQPMSNEDGRVWVTFNGEIFNFRELREDLTGRGHRFATRSDTEVLVHLHEELGPEGVERLNGQFAHAIWDGERLVCARDPLGIKPFYYYLDDAVFAFASEPRAFFAAGGLDLSIDRDALALYLRYGFVPAPFSAYRRVRKLRAGEQLVLERGGEPRLRRFFRLDDQPIEDIDRVEHADLRRALAGAVERQRVADFDVGAFLSGGIDSSSVAALMQSSASRPMRTFTLGFPEKDERGPAREVAEQIGSEHVDALFDHSAAGTTMCALLDRIDEPLGDSSLLPTHAVSCLAREHTKVALSGDGGDELFAGYGRHVRVVESLAAPAWRRSFWSVLGHSRRSPEPASWGPLDSTGVTGWADRIAGELDHPADLRLAGPALRDAAVGGVDDPIRAAIERTRALPPLSQVLAVDLETILPDRLLAKVDRASMQASLEVRVPLLDLEVVRLAFRLAPAARLHGGRPKGALAWAMSDDLPPGVFEREKQGFGPPIKYWFAREMAGDVEARLRDSIAVKEGLLDGRALRGLLRPRRGGRVPGPRLWRMLVLDAWLRNVKEGRLAT